MSTSALPSRGDVVLVDYPFSSGGGFKRRPALVLQNDRDNARLTSTIIAMITSHTARVYEDTQLLIDITTPEGQRTGLRQDSAVICNNLFTIEKRLVLQRIGALSANLMSQIDVCLKATLKLP
ncbi:MAG: type II toxin-antitoxin system PemK/MazF family toxin [Isosphaeraceae bacterium]